MAYVIWKVLMKKYSKVRIGLQNSLVTPVGQQALTYDSQSWKEKPEEDHDEIEDSNKLAENKKSKTKIVKNYIKNKYKNALGTKNSSKEKENAVSTSWYLEKITNRSEISELSEEAIETTSFFEGYPDEFRVANVIEIKHPVEENASCSDETLENSATSLSVNTDCVRESEDFFVSAATMSEKYEGCSRTSSLLKDSQEGIEVDEISDMHEEMKKAKRDVAGLVDRYFGDLYENYVRSKKCLIRQARDLLVCEYYGNLERFENEFCVQASKLLQHIKEKSSGRGYHSPSGWPLCVGACAIAIQLTQLDPSNIRNNDCYLSVKTRSLPGLEVALVWRKNDSLHSRTVAEFGNPYDSLDDVVMCSNVSSVHDLEVVSYDDLDGAELPELLQNLLVSVEHAIQRIPLDDLSFPCPQCLDYLPLEQNEDVTSLCSCQCSCKILQSPSAISKKEISIQTTSPMFEFAGSIPHIDSDAEDDKESIRSGSFNRRNEVARPRRISDLPEKLLLSGIYLPGTSDIEGRRLILCYAQSILKAGLNKYEIAKLLLYYSSIPTPAVSNKGFTIFMVADEKEAFKVSQLIEKSVCLIESNINISKIVIWRPKSTNDEEEKNIVNRIQTITVTDEKTLEKYVLKNQRPSSICGGTCRHDQRKWMDFFKQVEPFISNCKTTGRNLLSTLSKLRNEEVPSQITRKFLNHQCRQISKALQMECLVKLRKEGARTLNELREKSEKLSDTSNKDVECKRNFAENSFGAVDKVAQRLEQLERERRDRLKELAKFRTYQKEVDELINWIEQVADRTLNNLVLLLRNSVNSTGVKEITIDFEKFFFGAWRQIEKSHDLLEECRNLNEEQTENLKESIKNLGILVKSFKERLEETRVHLENSSRCFLLLETCHDILEDDNKEQEEFIKLASKSGNDKLGEICEEAEKNRELKPPDKKKTEPDKSEKKFDQNLKATSTPLKTPGAQIRRRSISSHAFIYQCSHHATGEICTCDESDNNESYSMSYRLKKKYLLTFQGAENPSEGAVRCNCLKDEKKLLDGIKEESQENLLEGCRRCDSGVSTGDNSTGEDNSYEEKNKKVSCSCQFCRTPSCCLVCGGRNSSSSSADDNTESQQDSIILEDNSFNVKSNSSDDTEDDSYIEEKRAISPINANKHLYCHASSLDLPSDVALYCNMDPKTQKTLKFIIKEMIETERDYVRSLDYVIVNYMPEISREDIPQALRGQRNIVFGNVEKIFEFHSQHFLRELEECENNPLQVGQIFLKHDKKFYLYALYNKNKPKSDTIMSEYGTIFFKSKQIELGDKMDLASYLLKPVQRMGKYALLLQQMMKACPPPPQNAPERVTQEFDDLRLAEEMVRFQLRHGNDLLAMDSIRECDVNLKEQGRLLRQNEFLVWEGRSGKKSLRQVFLFEELILFSKAKRFPDNKNLDLYYYKNSIKMTDIGLTPKVNDSQTKFEIWFRKRKPNDTFTLQSMSLDVKKAWTEELSQLLWKQAIRNRAVRMAEMSSMGIGNKPCLDIKPSADQISHRSISIAQLSRSAPRFRNSIAGSTPETCRNMKRPNSVISMSSVSSGSTSSSGASGSNALIGPTNSIIGCDDSTCDSPKPYHRSATLNSQCSMESGIIADMSMGLDDVTSDQHI